MTDRPLNVGDVLRSGCKSSCKESVTFVCLYPKWRPFDKFHKTPLIIFHEDTYSIPSDGKN